MTKRKAIKSKLTDHALAAAAGVAESTWRVHKQQGAPRPRNVSDVPRWVATYREWREARARRPGPAPRAAAAAAPDPKVAHWSSERMRWLAIRNRTAALRELRLLVRRDEVIEFAGKACLTARNKLNQMVQKMGSQFGEEVMQAAQLEVDDVLASFERGLEPAMHGYAWPEGTAAAASSTTPRASTTNSTHDVATGTQPGDDDEDESEVPGNLSGEFHNPPADDAGTTT